MSAAAPTLDRPTVTAATSPAVPGHWLHCEHSSTFLPEPGSVRRVDRDGTEWVVFAQTFVDC